MSGGVGEIGFNRDGTLAVRLDTQVASTIFHYWLFGRLVKMKNVCAHQPEGSRCHMNVMNICTLADMAHSEAHSECQLMYTHLDWIVFVF